MKKTPPPPPPPESAFRAILAAEATREGRYAELFVGSDNAEQEMGAMACYLDEAPRYPFVAEWRNPARRGHHARVTVLGVSETLVHGGVCCHIKRATGPTLSVPAYQLWPIAATEADNATVLDDYRLWFAP